MICCDRLFAFIQEISAVKSGDKTVREEYLEDFNVCPSCETELTTEEEKDE